MRENCTYSLSGGRWLARKRATSDPTPMKPSNQVTGQSPEAAEDPEGTPEGRARTKENVQKARAVPAQDGAAASQGLKGVRKGARERKQERFTTLLHHLTVDLLRDRCHALKRDAAPGVDAREMGGIRRRTGTTAERSARTGAPGQLPGTSVHGGFIAHYVARHIRCGNSARTDPCGGCEATRIPTATSVWVACQPVACRARPHR